MWTAPSRAVLWVVTVWVSVSPARPHPGPMSTVGCEPAPAPGTYWARGNQWARMIVPSNERTFQSDDEPATGVATTGWVGRG